MERIAMPAKPPPDPKFIERVNDERKHLEGLFKDRINFHIVFGTLFMAGLSTIDDLRIRVIALVTITIVSGLMALAILRTYRLVRLALLDIREDSTHPYTQYQGNVGLPNANNTLIAVPFILTLFFLIATGFYIDQWRTHHEGVKPPYTIFQTDDHSDRRVLNGIEPSQSPATSSTKGAANNKKPPKHR
jgi:hypothetical protein